MATASAVLIQDYTPIPGQFRQFEDPTVPEARDFVDRMVKALPLDRRHKWLLSRGWMAKPVEKAVTGDKLAVITAAGIKRLYLNRYAPEQEAVSQTSDVRAQCLMLVCEKGLIK